VTYGGTRCVNLLDIHDGDNDGCTQSDTIDDIVTVVVFLHCILFVIVTNECIILLVLYLELVYCALVSKIFEQLMQEFATLCQGSEHF